MWEQLRVQRENVRNLGLLEYPSKLSCLYVIDWTFEGVWINTPFKLSTSSQLWLMIIIKWEKWFDGEKALT